MSNHFTNMEQVYDYLEKNKDKVEKGALNDDALSQEMISLYHMHYACPNDPGAQGVLMSLCDKHLEREGGK